MGSNENLSLRDLSLKLVTLLGLVAPNRCAELAELDVKNMSKTKTTYVFYLPNPTKDL